MRTATPITSTSRRRPCKPVAKGFRVQGLGFRRSGFRFWGLGFRVQGVWILGCLIWCKCKVYGIFPSQGILGFLGGQRNVEPPGRWQTAVLGFRAFVARSFGVKRSPGVEPTESMHSFIHRVPL